VLVLGLELVLAEVSLVQQDDLACFDRVAFANLDRNNFPGVVAGHDHGGFVSFHFHQALVFFDDIAFGNQQFQDVSGINTFTK